jgi:hypothetical protein
MEANIPDFTAMNGPYPESNALNPAPIPRASGMQSIAL